VGVETNYLLPGTREQDASGKAFARVQNLKALWWKVHKRAKKKEKQGKGGRNGAKMGVNVGGEKQTKKRRVTHTSSNWEEENMFTRNGSLTKQGGGRKKGRNE